MSLFLTPPNPYPLCKIKLPSADFLWACVKKDKQSLHFCQRADFGDFAISAVKT